eukprot:TRINITY_DN58745_c0_g1_i1.p1 TRINITY_DN58745_c0_g1~~TRINITY_DN58745_c0_g1_i1.p1  ORF type:complete len:375 (+),score=79.87 TRINITY_DN58745_c0_g1_i1:66-1190(+)
MATEAMMMQPAMGQGVSQGGVAPGGQPVIEPPSPGTDQQQENTEQTREEAEGPRFQMPSVGSVQQVAQGGAEGQKSQETAPQRIQTLYASPMPGYRMGTMQGRSVPSLMTAAYGSPAVTYPYQAAAGQAAYQEIPLAYKQGPATTQMPASYQQAHAVQQMPASYQQAPIPAQYQQAQASQQLPVSYQDVQQMPAMYQQTTAAQHMPALYQQAAIPAQYQQAQATLPVSYQNAQQMPASYQQSLATQQIPSFYQQVSTTQQIPSSYKQVVSVGTMPQPAGQPPVATMQVPILTSPASFQASSSGTSSSLSWGPTQIAQPLTSQAPLQTSATVQGTEQATASAESAAEEAALEAQAGAKTPDQRRTGFFGRFCGSA